MRNNSLAEHLYQFVVLSFKSYPWFSKWKPWRAATKNSGCIEFSPRQPFMNTQVCTTVLNAACILAHLGTSWEMVQKSKLLLERSSNHPKFDIQCLFLPMVVGGWNMSSWHRGVDLLKPQDRAAGRRLERDGSETWLGTMHGCHSFPAEHPWISHCGTQMYPMDSYGMNGYEGTKELGDKRLQLSGDTCPVPSLPSLHFLKKTSFRFRPRRIADTFAKGANCTSLNRQAWASSLH